MAGIESDTLVKTITSLEIRIQDAHRAILPVVNGSADLKNLVAALRLVAGNLRTLSLLAIELEGDPATTTWTADLDILGTCRRLLDDVHRSLAHAHDAAPALRNVNARLTLASSATSILALLRCISTPGSVVLDGPNKGLSNKPCDGAVNPDPAHDKFGPLSFEATLEVASQALTLLLNSEFDRKLDECHIYRLYVAERDTCNPSYGKSAILWPAHAEQYWDQLRGDLTRLFHPRKTQNFAQWVLEYCRQQWPKKFGPGALSSSVQLLNLISTVTDSSLSTLHVAAALGLPRLCEYLISEGEDINQLGPLGTPLHCALLGPDAILTDKADPLAQVNDRRPSIDHEATIRIVLHARGSIESNPAGLGGEHTSLSTLAFLSCSELGASDVFSQLLSCGISFDKRFIDLFRPDELKNLDRRRQFLAVALSNILDKAIQVLADSVGFDNDDMTTLCTRIWAMIEKLQLDCAKLENKRKISSIPDSRFLGIVRQAIRNDGNVILRLMQDPRWDPDILMESADDAMNHSSSSSDSDDSTRPRRRRSIRKIGRAHTGKTILHYAVEGYEIDLVRNILRSGADVHVRDSQNRTPLLLSESPEVLELLIQHGASTVDTDVMGRNIWHFAAANNDCPMLHWLIANDPEMDRNLRGLMRGDRTPLAEAIAFHLEMARTMPKGTGENQLHAAIVLLMHSKGKPAYLKNGVPLFHLAAEWGIQVLAEGLLDAGADPNEVSTDQRSPLHRLNFSATESLVDFLNKHCTNVPLQTKEGLTPAETIFLNFNTTRRGNSLTDHPCCSKALERDVYMRLLTPETLASKDSTEKQRGLWERFCTHILSDWAMKWSVDFIATCVTVAVDCLVDRGVLATYEEETRSCALLLVLESLMKSSRQVDIPNWMEDVFFRILNATKQLEKFKESDHAILCLRWAIRGNRTTLFENLLRNGLSVHHRLQGTSTLELVCLGNSPCSLPMFKKMLEYVDRTKLNEVNAAGQGLIHMLLDPRVQNRDEKLRALLSKGCDPNLKRWGTSPAVVSYIMDRQIDGAVTLLDNGADPAATTKDGLDAALAAASRGSVRLLDKIKSMAKPGFNWQRTCTSRFTIIHPGGHGITTSASNCTALHLAAFNGHELVLHFYLSSFKMDVEAQVLDDLRRPLHFAAVGGSSTCVRILHQHGANPATQSRQGSTPLHAAVQGCQPGTVRILLELGPKNPVDREGITPFLYALQTGVKDILDMFSPHMQSLEPPDMDGDSLMQRTRIVGGALETLINQNDLQACKNLLLAVPRSALRSAVLKCHDCTPIMLAIRKCRASFVNWFLEIGLTGFVGCCKVHFGPHGGFNALNEAAERPLLAMSIEPLLDAYLKNGINWHNAPLGPLHCAAYKHNETTCAIIIDHIRKNAITYRQVVSQRIQAVIVIGANWPATRRQRYGDRSPQTDLELTTSRSNIEELISEIVNKRVSQTDLGEPYDLSWTPLHVAIDANAQGIAALLVRNGADVNAPDGEYNTPLHLAARAGFYQGAEYLLKNGANPNIRNTQAYSPLTRAAERGQLKIAQLLVKHGADIHACESDGMSLLNTCGEQSKSPALFLYFMSIGLDPYRQDKAGYMPIHDIILNGGFASLAFNYGFDFSRVGDISKGLLSMVIELNFRTAGSILLRLLKKLPGESVSKMVNFNPQRFVSALCNAVLRDELPCIPLLLKHGAEIDAEGAVEGSALMVACMKGRIEAVKILIGFGAAISYTAVVNGRSVLRNALEYAKPFPRIVRWLLVQRHTKQRLLQHKTWSEDSAIKQWSGLCQVGYDFTGIGTSHGRERKESSLQYLRRTRELRLTLRGKVVVASSTAQ